MQHPLNIVLLITACLVGCSSESNVANGPHLDVFKSPTCGCCNDWITHIEASGFATATHHPEDLGAIKEQHGIGLRYGSCHTAVSDDGYVFEGHVPAKLVKQFLAAAPAGTIGLSVPGMPLGSPGMEVDDQFMPYEVLLLNRDGSSEVYASVATQAEQYD